MNKYRQQQNEDIDDIYASVMSNQINGSSRTGLKLTNRIRARRHQRAKQAAKEEGEKQRQERRYRQFIFESPTQVPPAPKHASHATLLRQRIKELSPRQRTSLQALAVACLVAVIILALVKILPGIFKDQPAAKGQETIVPEKVYVPSELPEGYSVGSGSQKLENGAVLYIVFDDKGHEISITQQAKDEKLNESMLGGAMSFDTRLGKAYIIETTDRITGYILTDTTMLLFNSVEAVSSASLKLLMQTFQP